MALHRALDGDGPLPFEYWIGRLCEEFHCLPSQALREVMRAPAGLLETIIEFRQYARAKAAYDAQGMDPAASPLMTLVRDHDFAIVRETRAAADPNGGPHHTDGGHQSDR